MNPFFKRYQELGETPTEIELKPTIRVNTLKMSNEDVFTRLRARRVDLKHIKTLKHAYTVNESDFSLGASIEYLLGYISLQEHAAQYAVEVLDPKPNELILDMCAAPGNKTTQIAEYMKNTGTLIALEPFGRRVKVLHNFLERTGTTNTTVYNIDGRQADELFMKFDRVLVDAPCSGNFAIDDTWLEKRDLEGVEANARLQKQLLVSAVDVTKEGGILVYSTCSLEPEENELMLDWLLKEFPHLKILEIDTPGDEGLTNVFGNKLNDQIKNARRFWPWKTNTQGFFIAKIQC